MKKVYSGFSYAIAAILAFSPFVFEIMNEVYQWIPISVGLSNILIYVLPFILLNFFLLYYDYKQQQVFRGDAFISIYLYKEFTRKILNILSVILIGGYGFSIGSNNLPIVPLVVVAEYLYIYANTKTVYLSDTHLVYGNKIICINEIESYLVIGSTMFNNSIRLKVGSESTVINFETKYTRGLVLEALGKDVESGH